MRRRAAWAVVVAAFATTACEDLVDADSIAGSYDLVEVNGERLPAVMFEGETEFGYLVATAESGLIRLRASTFTQVIEVSATLDGTAFPAGDVENSGDYSVDGQLLTFDPETPGRPTFTGTLTGSTLFTSETDPDFGELSLTWSR